MACAKVFGSYELVEQILLSLPLREIILARQITKACDDVFQRSLGVRRAVFLVPTADMLYLNKAEEQDKLAWRCSSEWDWCVWTDSPHHSVEDYRARRPAGVAKMPILNPFIDVCDYGHLMDSEIVPQGKRVVVSICHYKDGRLFGSLDILTASGVGDLGSRGDMAFTHPPTEQPLKLSYGPSLTKKSAIGTYRAVVEYAVYLLGKGVRGITPFAEATSFVRFTGTIDTITGFEMLEMLRMSEDELLESGLVVKRKASEK